MCDKKRERSNTAKSSRIDKKAKNYFQVKKKVKNRFWSQPLTEDVIIIFLKSSRTIYGPMVETLVGANCFLLHEITRSNEPFCTFPRGQKQSMTEDFFHRNHPD